MHLHRLKKSIHSPAPSVCIEAFFCPPPCIEQHWQSFIIDLCEMSGTFSIQLGFHPPPHWAALCLHISGQLYYSISIIIII